MSEKILIVDDSAADRLIIKNMLRDYEVLTAEDGFQALEILSEDNEIGLIVLDLNMPGMSGFEVLSRLKEDHRFCKIRSIILTNYDELDNEILGLKLGAIDYIRKPVNIESLRARIDIHLEFLRVQTILESRLEDKAHTLDTVFFQAPIGISISHSMTAGDFISHDMTSINPAFEKITGWNKESLIRMGWAKITHPDDLAEDVENYNKLQSGEIESYSMDKRFIRPDGKIVWVHMVVASLSQSDNGKYRYICLIQDISRRKATESALAESERSKAVLLSHLPGLAYRCSYDKNWTMQFVSDGCYDLTGWPASSLLQNKDLTFNDLIVPEYRSLLWQQWQQVLASKEQFKQEYEIITASGQKKWVLELGQGIYSADGEVEALEGIILDVSDRKDVENSLRFATEHDTWTGLYNLRYLENLLRQEAHKHRTEARALIGINMSALHAFNLTYGFRYTRMLIKNVAQALEKFIDDKRMLFLVYEQQFAFYIKSYEKTSDLTDFCQKVFDTLRNLLKVERVNVGIGIVEIDEENEAVLDRLLKSLLIASERALEHLDALPYNFFDQGMEAEIQRRDDITRELLEIASKPDDERLFLQYQPILDLKTRQICCFEALARLRSPKYGLISPLEFIPIAEESKLIIPLGENILRQSFNFMSRLTSNGYTDIGLSVNVSAIQLLKPDFISNLNSMISEMQINPNNLSLEITESILAQDYTEINRILGEIKETGINIAIDDFGTGYSSLARERELNVNCLKIDKAFIDKLMYLNPEDAITGDIISMAHRRGHYVIAEGVEHEEQMLYLADHECDCIQGFLISKPQDGDRAIELLTRQARDSERPTRL
ncbi:MAG: EAL domain-containing protein [Eubacteriales bacterium]|nr:EAL domain-containing protein [Eubacteriales bacterium]MDD3197057.1 EAL domain-containing protein [Eubacteriales bacterium]MDD3503385.1 EAL domain-containing protein [Eubacteriales bacterium]MDD4683052.1 EAL domain-containing protein [Eubacteriales bacterium]